MSTLPNCLDSYHYVGSQRKVDEMRADGAQIFLDSGAFSAFTTNKPINIDEYARYVLENEDIIEKVDGVLMASVLDGIGDAQQTLNQQAYLEKKGVTTLPCYHFSEPLEYLDYYIARYPYITIGGLVGKSSRDLKSWLDGIWDSHLTDGSGNPRLKVHAFGITSTEILQRYPWYSADSSSWLQYGLFGNVYTNHWLVLGISKDKQTRKEAGKHYDSFNEMEQMHIKAYLEESGIPVEDMRQAYNSRAVYNAREYVILGDQINNGGLRNGFASTQQLF